jgi:polar amino acid transport system substrate-binding protein
MIRSSKLLIVGLCCAGASVAAVPSDDAQIAIVFSERLPHIYSVQRGEVNETYRGPWYELAQKIVSRAGLVASFDMLPQLRRDATISANQSNSCALGVFKTSEREQFGQFTLPIGHDAPWPVISRAESVKTIRQSKNLKSFMRESQLSGVFLLGVSHGPYVEPLIEQMSPAAEKFGSAPAHILRMIEIGHGDFTILPMDILEVYKKGNPGSTLRATTFPDIPGQPVYLMCSKRVPSGVMERLNRAIKSLKP